MITKLNPLGSVSMTDSYFSDLVGHAVQSCFGVAGMGTVDTADSLLSRMTKQENKARGVRVNQKDGILAIELHIKVAYGVNIPSIVDSITHRVRSEVENATSLRVERVDVFVDDIVG